jgi:hypothetical protein
MGRTEKEKQKILFLPFASEVGMKTLLEMHAIV